MSARAELAVGRRRIADHLYHEPSYGVFDAMVDMGTLSEGYLLDAVLPGPDTGLWVGGSLGRCEMLPNSDLDLFVVRDAIAQNLDLSLGGFDKIDLAEMNYGVAESLLDGALVDANRIIDGRPVGECDVGARLRRAVQRCNTPDRQLANLIAEHAYFHFFDFPLKRTALGPNLKYSSGSGRVTLFFNFVHRYLSGEVPALRSSRPELEQSLGSIEARLERRAPRRSIELISLVKCAAITVYDATGDRRARYVSRPALSMIHDICRERMKAWGIQHVDDLLAVYADSRHEIALTVDELVAVVLSGHPCAAAFRAVADAPVAYRTEVGATGAADFPEWRRALLTHAAWLLVTACPPADLVRALADDLMERPVADAWGGLMAVACSQTADDETLRRLLTWLASNEPGAYLAKLVRRNPAASAATRQTAEAQHASREVLREMPRSAAG